VRKNAFQDFKALWDKILEKYPLIKDFPPLPFLGFELYGSVNPIVVQYKVPLDIAYLYTLIGTDLFPPEETYHLPMPKKFFEGDVSEETYQRFEKEVEDQYVKEKSIEGVMFYLQNVGDKPWVAYKCKSKSLLQDSADHTLSKNEIKTTAINALEITDSMDELLETTIKLLKETYTPEYIDFNHEMVQVVVNDLISHIKKEKEIVAKYNELKLDLKNDKVNTMRTIMKYYNKKDSAYIFTTLAKYVF